MLIHNPVTFLSRGPYLSPRSTLNKRQKGSEGAHGGRGTKGNKSRRTGEKEVLSAAKQMQQEVEVRAGVPLVPLGGGCQGLKG